MVSARTETNFPDKIESKKKAESMSAANRRTKKVLKKLYAPVMTKAVVSEANRGIPMVK